MQPIPCSSSSSSSPFSIQRLSIEYDGWWITSGVPSSRAVAAASGGRGGGGGGMRRGGGLRGPGRRVRRDADVQRLAGADRVVERSHGLLDRRLRVEAVAVEDVDVL